MSKVKLLPDAELLRACLLYDPLTGVLTWRVREPWTFNLDIRFPNRLVASWNAQHPHKEAFFTPNKNGYLNGYLIGILYLAHRVIWKMQTLDEPLHIDHINGIRWDNRFSNLRSVQPSENAKNLAVSSRNTSGVMGVFWHKTNQRWNANIKHGGRLVHLGTFETQEEAIEARKKAAAEFGFHTNHGKVLA